MKVIHIIVGLNKGGAEGALLRLIQSTSSPNIENRVISLTSKGEIGEALEDMGCDVRPLNMSSALTFPYVFIKLCNEIKLFNPDIVQTWMYHADFFGGIAARLLGIKKIIWNVRTTDISFNKNYLTRTIRYLCAKISYTIPSKIVYVAYKGMQLHEELGYQNKKSLVISNGYVVNKYQVDTESRLLIRHSLGIKDNEDIIGFIGRFHPTKGVENFIKSAKILIKYKPGIKFLMVGKGMDLRNGKLISLIEQEGILNKFILVGESKNIITELLAMDIFVLSSKTEGFPNVLAEAMLMRLPCVSTDVGDASMILNNLGIIVPPEDSIELSIGIKKLLDLSKLEREKIGMLSSTRISDNFSIVNFSESYLKIYNELAGE